MCGIIGIVNFKNAPVAESNIREMMLRIKHRGPDDEGVFIQEGVGMGFVRLGIIDLSNGGHQPMNSSDGRFVLTFNGEIYNYLELKKELEPFYTFKSKSDTEVLLAAYTVWGENCLDKLNGDFAFAVYDKQTQKLFGARDRFGIKPFYYAHSKDAFCYASEIKALLPTHGGSIPNEQVIYDYLAFNRSDSSNETFFKDIVKVPPGHCFTIEQDKFTIRQWYNLRERLTYPTVLTQEHYREALKSSIGLRLRSDVPLGVCLSGGLDSSAITSMILHDFKIDKLQTFSAVFNPGSWADESMYIDCFKGKVGLMHKTQPDAVQFLAEMDGFMTLHSEPIPSVSPYAQYKVMQLAQGKVTVTIDGQGADEMLGGYSYFYGIYLKELLYKMQYASFIKEAYGHFAKVKSNESFAFFFYYALPKFLKQQTAKKTGNAIAQGFFHQYAKSSQVIDKLLSPNNLHTSLLEHFDYKLQHLLKWNDLNAMYFSIESRVPFLDHHLVEQSLSLPSNTYMQGGLSKTILRQSVKDILPQKIYERTGKIGFDAPSDEWFKSKPFVTYITDLLHSKTFKEQGYFNPSVCKVKFDEHLNGKRNHGKEIWKWINLTFWHQTFIATH